MAAISKLVAIGRLMNVSEMFTPVLPVKSGSSRTLLQRRALSAKEGGCFSFDVRSEFV